MDMIWYDNSNYQIFYRIQKVTIKKLNFCPLPALYSKKMKTSKKNNIKLNHQAKHTSHMCKSTNYRCGYLQNSNPLITEFTTLLSI